MSDLLLQEIDDELRHDRLKAFWKKHGTLAGAVVLAFVLLIAGWRGYGSWQQSQAAKDGDLFSNALKAGEGRPEPETMKQFERLANSGTKGTAALARFRLAGNEARLGDKIKALNDFDALVKDTSLDKPLRDMASVRAAMLAFDQGDYDGVVTRVRLLANESNGFRHSARELMGLAAYKKGDKAEAARWFDELMADPACPSDLRARGEMMAALLEADGVNVTRTSGQAAPPKE
jgi:hypothetical protein